MFIIGRPNRRVHRQLIDTVVESVTLFIFVHDLIVTRYQYCLKPQHQIPIENTAIQNSNPVRVLQLSPKDCPVICTAYRDQV